MVKAVVQQAKSCDKLFEKTGVEEEQLLYSIEKLRLDTDLLSADLRRVVLFREYLLLKEFEKRDMTLKNKLDLKLQEKSDALSRIEECQDRLQTKKEDVEKLAERKKVLSEEFDSLVEDSNPFRDALQKIFLRRIKRAKKKTRNDDDEDYEEEEEEDDDDDEDDDEDFDDEEEEEVCPLGCDQALYEKVCDLRERRLDQDEVATELQKMIDTLKKERDSLSKKQKLVETALKSIDGEIVEFQKEKQSKLNEIDVVVTLRMHQIMYLVDDRLPERLEGGLVFSHETLQRLRERIKELASEKAALRQQQRELKKEHMQLARGRQEKERRIAELETKARDVQMLKFGQLINLSLLDKAGVNKAAEELKDQLKLQEARQARELKEAENVIRSKRHEFATLMRENTGCLEQVAGLTRAQRELERGLNDAAGTLLGDNKASRVREAEQRDQLVQLVNAQAGEIESLKGEILLLRSKGAQLFAG